MRINSLRDTVHVDNRAATIRKPIAVDVITFLLADDIETLSLSLLAPPSNTREKLPTDDFHAPRREMDLQKTIREREKAMPRESKIASN